MTILLISGSPSLSSQSTRLMLEFAAQLHRCSYKTSHLTLCTLPAQALLSADLTDAAMVAAHQQVASAEALVIATPIYKAAYSGLLKVFLDSLPQDGLHGKLVQPLASGGSAAHTLVLDYALRPVLASLGARHVLSGIYATGAQVIPRPEGGTTLDADLTSRLCEGVASLTRNLWAQQEIQRQFNPELNHQNNRRAA
jgi:FMN reductase